MLYDAAWRAQIVRVISGALRIWQIPGTVGRDPDDADGFVISLDQGSAIRLRHGAAAGWTLARRAAASDTGRQLGSHAGLPGLLRRLRDELAPDAPAGRLVIGSQPLLGRDPRNG
jgi:hypothetical protein